MTIHYSSTTTTAHKQFINWTNALLGAYTKGPWDNSMKNILVAAFIQKVTVFIQEMYSADGKTPVGYVVVTDMNNTYHALYFSYSAGDFPVYICSTGLEQMLELDTGVVKQFFTNTEVTMQHVTSGTAKLLLVYEVLYGIKFPVFTISTPAGDFIAKGVLDFFYDQRTSSSYSLEIEPIDGPNTVALHNKSSGVLKFQLPILEGFSVEYKILPGQTILVPRTELVEYFIRTSFDQNTVSIDF